MTSIKYNFLINIFSFFRTLRNKKWLDTKGYIYTLNFFSFFANDHQRVQEIRPILESIDIGKTEYHIFLTKFGTYGSYSLPNKIFLNIYQPLNKISDVLKHEVKHLQVEDIVLKQNLSHAEKEKLVNSIKNN
jgi:hypothetical protein